jgi:hypothetical protein
VSKSPDQPEIAESLRLTEQNVKNESKGSAMKAVYFTSRAAFREWLAKNHATATQLLIGFYIKHTGKSGATYDQAVVEALCYGWIDGGEEACRR